VILKILNEFRNHNEDIEVHTLMDLPLVDQSAYNEINLASAYQTYGEQKVWILSPELYQRPW